MVDLPDSMAQINREITIVRTRKQNAIIFIQKTEPRNLNCLTHARGDPNLVSGNWVDRVEMASDKSCNCVSKTMGAGKAVSI